MPENNLYQKNVSFLKKRDPLLAQRVERHSRNATVSVLFAKNGNPVPVIGSVSLHSRYDPDRESQILIENTGDVEGVNCLIFGLGFGYHIEKLAGRKPSKITVIEPSLDLFQVFLETCDLGYLGCEPEFFIGQTPAHVASKLSDEKRKILEHPPTVRLHPRYFDELKKGFSARACLKKQSLRVLVIPPIYGGSLPTARYCFDSLKLLGHKPTWVNCDKYAEGFFDMQQVTGNKAHETVLSRKFLEYLSEMIIASAAEARPDIILALAQAPLDKETVSRLKALGAPVAFWFVEDFRTLTYWNEMAPCYDSVFTLQQGEFHDKLKEIGVANPYYLPQACHPDIHRALSLSRTEINQFGSDLSFMGAAYYNRTRMFEQLLGYDFKIWGTGWDPSSVYGEFLQNKGARVETEDAVKIFNASRINLNLHSSTFHEGVNPNGDFINPRTFEIASCKGFQLVDRRSELVNKFDLEKEVVTFSDVRELKEKIEYFVSHPDECQRIANASHKRVLKDHTFKQRMQEMLIQIFIDHEDKLSEKLKNHQSDWDRLWEECGEDSSLREILKRYEDVSEFDIKSIREDIQKGEGTLSDAELLVLMVDQVVKS